MIYIFIYSSLLAGVYFFNGVTASQKVKCVEDKEFLCEFDNRCIPKTKVCNFEPDCSDGADEVECGTCEFDEGPDRCGLNFESDRLFSWAHKRPVIDSDLQDDPIKADVPKYHMHIKVDNSLKQVVMKALSNPLLEYHPNILFPHLRPTNNEGCRFTFKMMLTEKGPLINGHAYAPISSPSIIIRTTRPTTHINDSDNNFKHQVHDLRQVIMQRREGRWSEYEIPIGKMSTVWTIEIAITMGISNRLIYLGSFKFVDCQNLAAVDGEHSDEDGGEAWPDTCAEDEFKCVETGRCIDKQLVCDYGHDCGEDDISDEKNCDAYPGRCDFDEESLCDWKSEPESSWLWTGVGDPVESNEPPRVQPTVDHTYQSSQIGGHYMLLNISALSPKRMLRFSGPHLSLQEGFNECVFRFWYYLPQSLENSKLESGRFQVSVEQADVGSLMSEKADEGGWRRRQVLVLDNRATSLASLTAQISFGLLDAQDIVEFKSKGGFLALDDFSFTPGCELTVQGEPVYELCTEHQYFCKVPTPVTAVSCIPLEYYCDFKSDCGRHSVEVPLADDEMDCPSRCSFNEQEQCKYQVIDASSLKQSGEVLETDRVNEAFRWSIISSNREGSLRRALEVRATVAEFLSTLLMQFSSKDTSSANLRSLRIELPQFSESHANCMFELDYSWAPKAYNLALSVIIEGTHLKYATLIWRDTSHSNSSSGFRDERVAFGVGAQNGPFRLIVEVSFLGDLYDRMMALKPPSGSVIVNSYAFVNCSFPAGVLDDGRQVHSEDSREEDYALQDYPLEPTSGGLNRSCGHGQFQCEQPVLCIPPDLVCDMQRDCQGGLDERHCDGYLRYTFDEEEALADWLQDESSKLRWSLYGTQEQAVGHSRALLKSGPAYDHTRNSTGGRFAMIRGLANQTASLFSRRFRALSRTCRLVFHLYLWGADVGEFRVLRVAYPSADGQGAAERELYRGGQRLDRWQRIAVALEPEDEHEFSVVFQASAGEGGANLIAVDDVSFSPECGTSERAATASRLLLGVAYTSTSDKAERKATSEGGFGPFVLAVSEATALLMLLAALARTGSLRRLVGGELGTYPSPQQRREERVELVPTDASAGEPFAAPSSTVM